MDAVRRSETTELVTEVEDEVEAQVAAVAADANAATARAFFVNVAMLARCIGAL
jgi:hypothetical protein